MESVLYTLLCAYFLLHAGFAGKVATHAVEEDDRLRMSRRVYRSTCGTTLLLGVPLLLTFMVWWFAQYGGDGLVTKGRGLLLLGLFGTVGLLAVWIVLVVSGYIGTAIAKRLPAAAAGAVVFVACTVGLPLFFLVYRLGNVLSGRATTP